MRLNELQKREEVRKPIRILFEIHNLETAGAQKMMIDLALRFQQLGHKVFILVLSDNPHNNFSDLITRNKIRIIYVKCSNNKLVSAYRRYRAIGSAIVDFKPDIIHSHLDYKFLWLYAFIHNIRFVATFHSQPYRLNSPSFRFLFSILHRKHLIITVNLTKSNAAEFSELYSVRMEEQVVIPNPIDLSKFEGLSRNKNGVKGVGGNSHPIQICFAARFHPVKNHKMLIEAFKRIMDDKALPDCDLLLAGEGETKKDIEQLVSQLNIKNHVRFLGDVSDIPKLLQSVDIGVISSDSESFPLFLLECMATGLPVVLTHVGGMRDLVDGNGVFVEKGNVDQMSEALKSLIINKDMRVEMGKKGLELVKQYDINTIADQYLKLYQRVMVR